jgi:hypothetical protein
MKNKEELEIERSLLKEIAKGYENKIKAKQKELEEEKKYYSGFSVHIEGKNENLAKIENTIEIYINEKIRFEKWAKKLKHEIEEL